VSKETDRLDDLGIHNNHNLVSSGDKVWVDYRAPDYSRAGFGSPSGWLVFKIGKDLGNHWTERGAKVFWGLKRNKEVMVDALNFASTLNGQKEWVKSPFGGYISKATADKNKIKYAKNKIIEIKTEKE